MNRSQARGKAAAIKAVCAKVRLAPADQFYCRTSEPRFENGNTFWDVEARIINADDDYDSGWYWLDAIGVGPRGRII